LGLGRVGVGLAAAHIVGLLHDVTTPRGGDKPRHYINASGICNHNPIPYGRVSCPPRPSQSALGGDKPRHYMIIVDPCFDVMRMGLVLQ
jgi:hypothetical protein